MRIFVTALALLSVFSNPASATMRPELKEQIEAIVNRLVDDPTQLAEAIGKLDCGEELPVTGEPADLILYYAYGKPEEDELNSTTTHRLEKVSELFSRHLGKKIIVTGNGYPEKKLAKNGMRFLVDRGVPSEKLIMDDTSTTTWKNIEHGLEIFEKEHAKSALFVSSPYHIDRIMNFYEIQTRDKQRKTSRMKIYWSRYDHKLDDMNYSNKKSQVYVEIMQSITNHIESGSPLRSDHCRNYDKKVGREGQYEAFLQNIIDKSSARSKIQGK